MKNMRNKINHLFVSLTRTVYKHRIKTIFLCFLFVAGFASQIPKITMNTSIDGFLHKSDKTLMDYNKFRDQFGREELIILAIKKDNIFDLNFLKKLESFHKELESKVKYLDDITSLVNARDTRGNGDKLTVEDLIKDFPKNKKELANLKQRVKENELYKNIVISEDMKFTNIIITLQAYSPTSDSQDVMAGFEKDNKKEEAGKKYITDKEVSEAVESVLTVVTKFEAKDFPISVSGSTIVADTLKKNMRGDMRLFMRLTLLIIAIFLFLVFRRISGLILPLVIVFISILSTIGLMGAAGIPLKILSQILPSLLLAIGVSSSVHILAIFYNKLRENNHNKKEAIIYAIEHSGLAVVMTNVTTAVGVFSFATSEVAPISELGYVGSFGIILAMIFTIVLLPAFISLLPIKNKSKVIEKNKKTLMDNVLLKISHFSTSYPKVIVVFTVLLLILSIIGISKIRFGHDMISWFPSTHPLRVATQLIDKNLKGSVTLEVVVDTGKENGLYDPALMNKIEDTIEKVEHLKVGKIYTGKAWSITSILKETNRALNENKLSSYKIPASKNLIAQELLLFENSGSDDLEDFTDSQLSKARLTLKVPLEDAIGYRDYLVEVNKILDKELSSSNVKIYITGLVPIMAKAITNAIFGMGKSYIIAIVIITLLMIVLVGRLKIGLLSMVPNLIPIITMLGMMGLFGMTMNMFAMLVGSIAMGLAVDDTIHFMHNFRRYYEETGDPKKAIYKTMFLTGRAMLVTTCVLAAGFFVYTFASLNNLVNFGILTGFTIIMALISDFFIGPALLVLTIKKISVDSNDSKAGLDGTLEEVEERELELV